MATFCTKHVPYGLATILPLRGFPPGKARIRLREDEFVRIRIRTRDGIREFHPEIVDGVWKPLVESGSNTTVRSPLTLRARIGPNPKPAK